MDLNHKSVCDLILPRCYLSQLDAQNDVLVLENLAFSGYRTYNEEHLNDLDHCRVVLRRMAHFHAISTLMQVGKITRCTGMIFAIFIFLKG